MGIVHADWLLADLGSSRLVGIGLLEFRFPAASQLPSKHPYGPNRVTLPPAPMMMDGRPMATPNRQATISPTAPPEGPTTIELLFCNHLAPTGLLCTTPGWCVQSSPGPGWVIVLPPATGQQGSCLRGLRHVTYRTLSPTQF